MNCNEFELIVLEVARNQLMDVRADGMGLAHAESCLRCSGRLASERFLIAGTRAVVAEMATEEAPARVEAALLAAFRNQVSAVTSPTFIPTPFTTNSWSSYWKPVAVAASMSVLISTMAVFWLYSKSLNESKDEVTGLSAPIGLPKSLAVPVEPGRGSANVLANSRPPDRLRPRVSKRKMNQAEVVTEFYPLVEGEDFDFAEITQVVRVELPASALSAAGVAVGPDISTIPVKADVALGYDGLARAVRFVNRPSVNRLGLRVVN